MRIGEIAELTGISISNIRFYEKKGLIEPDREENSKYRNYTEEDLARIKLIILYRKMDLSVEQIEKILSKQISLNEVLAEKMEDLQKKQKEIQGALDLCHKVSDSFEENEIDYYLSYVKEEEAKGNSFAAINEFMDDITEFTSMDRLQMGYLSIRFPWISRVIAFLLGCLFFAVPVIGILDAYLDETLSLTKVLFWILWMLTILVSFVVYRRKKKMFDKP